MSRTDIPKLVPGAHEKLTLDERCSLPGGAKSLPEDSARAMFDGRRVPRRTPEAQADIAAAHAAPTADQMQAEDDAWLQARDEERRRAAARKADMIEQARAQGGDREAEAVADALDVHTAFRAGDGPPVQVTGLEGEFAHCECPSHLDQDGVVTRRPSRTPEVHGASGIGGPQCAHAMLQPDCPRCEAYRIERASAEPTDVIKLDAALSNTALADTPAVREMGAPRNVQADLAHAVGALERIHKTLWSHRDPCDVKLDDLVHGVATLKIERDEARAHGEQMRQELEGVRRRKYAALDPESLPPGVLLLAGPEAERYRAITAAARKAQASATTARADGAALLQLFQAFCAGVAPEGKP